MSRGQIRIIGGEWRGRKLAVPDSLHLRPTPDRVKETLFNWLAPVIAGAYCLDAFAGSGGLGFEALSRGAKQVTFVDDSPLVIDVLSAALKKFTVLNAEIYRAKVPDQLKQPAHPFDIVFLDPPFQQNLLLPTCFFLADHHFLAPNAYIYLESALILQQNDLPAGWEILKNKKAGQVVYHLVKRSS